MRKVRRTQIFQKSNKHGFDARWMAMDDTEALQEVRREHLSFWAMVAHEMTTAHWFVIR